MKSTIRPSAVGLIILACGVASLGAAALPPVNNEVAPPCWRGAGGSTVQKWTFTTTNATNISFTAPNLWAPDTFTNLNGTPSVAIVPGRLGRWVDIATTNAYPSNTTIQGAWNVDPDGGMTFTIPNSLTPPTGAYQYVVVQAIEFPSALPSIDFANITVTNAVQVGATQRINTGTLNGMGNPWIDSKSVWRFASVPTSEVIGLTPLSRGSIFDAVIMDTLLVAPPAHTNITATTSSNSQMVAWASLADGCIFTNEVCTPPSGSSFAVGTNAVNCTLADLYGYTTPSQFKVTVQASGVVVPPCAIKASGTNLLIAWPDTGHAFTLVKAGAVTAPRSSWSQVGIGAEWVGGRWQVTIPAPATNTFYRLRYP